MFKPQGVHVAHDDHRRAQQAGGGGGGHADRARTSHIDGAAGANARADGAVESRGQDVRQTGQVADLRHGLIAIGEAQQVEVGIRHHDVLGLAAYPVTHVHVAVRAARARRVHGQADAGVLFLAGAAAAAGHVERH
ncbi:hypothetical protein D3C72_1443030 [compost metagenome]